MKEPVVLSWSSGKDAAMAYHFLKGDANYEVKSLLTTITSEADRVFMHGVRGEILEAQAFAMNLPLHKVKLAPSPDDELYKAAMKSELGGLKAKNITACAFGDIFLEDLRAYREAQLVEAGFTGVFPLWKQDTRRLIGVIESAGIEAIIVCVNAAVLGKEFLGRKIDASLLQDLPAGVDACGENGEYHTCAVNAPFFHAPISYRIGETVFKTYGTPDKSTVWDTGFYFLDVIPG